MGTFGQVATQMLVFLALIAAGALLRRVRVLTDSIEKLLSRAVMNFTLPAMILASVLTSEQLPSLLTIAQLLLFSFASYAVAIGIGELLPRLYCRRSRSERGAHSFSTTFGNVGFMGLPVLDSVFGSSGVLYGAIFNIPFNLFVFTAGVAMIAPASDGQADKNDTPKAKRVRWFKQVLRSLATPAVLASLASIVLCLLHITDAHGVIGQGLHAIGMLTTPGSMLIIGSLLAKMSLKSTLTKPLPYLTCLLRLAGVPVIVFALFSLLHVEPLALGVLTLTSGMPVATLGGMLSLVHGGDTETIARTTFISTIGSLITIPLLAVLVT